MTMHTPLQSLWRRLFPLALAVATACASMQPPAALAAPEKPSTAQAPAAQAAPWDLRLARFDLDGGRIQWRDESVNPAAAIALSALRVETSGLSWPVRAPIPFDVSVQLDQSPIGIKGTATDVAAQAELSLGEISLGLFAPYISSALKPALEGRLAAGGRLEWQAAQGD
eukprot:gene40088-63914_t